MSGWTARDYWWVGHTLYEPHKDQQCKPTKGEIFFFTPEPLRRQTTPTPDLRNGTVPRLGCLAVPSDAREGGAGTGARRQGSVVGVNARGPLSVGVGLPLVRLLGLPLYRQRRRGPCVTVPSQSPVVRGKTPRFGNPPPRPVSGRCRHRRDPESSSRVVGWETLVLGSHSEWRGSSHGACPGPRLTCEPHPTDTLTCRCLTPRRKHPL